MPIRLTRTVEPRPGPWLVLSCRRKLDRPRVPPLPVFSPEAPRPGAAPPEKIAGNAQAGPEGLQPS